MCSYTRILTKMGQSLWDDIKIPGHQWDTWYQISCQMGHYLHSLFQNKINSISILLKSYKYCFHLVICKINQFGAISFMVSDVFIWNLGKPGEDSWDMRWDIDIKIGGKFVGHWYQKSWGVPCSPECVYLSYSFGEFWISVVLTS